MSSVDRASWLPTLAAHMSRVRLSVRPEASSVGTSSRRPFAVGALASTGSLLEVLCTCCEHSNTAMSDYLQTKMQSKAKTFCFYMRATSAAAASCS